jgi:7-carboxy-7-deazaguanine synthase
MLQDGNSSSFSTSFMLYIQSNFIIRDKGYHITIETAGTVMPSGIECDLASLSPKLKNSTPDSSAAGAWRARHEKSRYQPEVLRAWIRDYQVQLKLVVTSAADLPEIEAMLNDVAPFPRDRVLLMPEGREVEGLRERSPLIAELCRERGFRFAPRLQIELYGNRRGT